MTGCASAEPFVTTAIVAPYLGLEVDAVTDAQALLIERAGKTALALVESHIGYPLVKSDFVQSENYIRTASVVLVNRAPLLSVDRIVMDGKALAKWAYTIDEDTSLVKFACCQQFRTLIIEGEAGYASFADLKPDLAEALVSICIGVYNRNGTLAMPAAADTALKSLTMFDAMSMSFDQAGSIEALSPQKLVEQWAFVLNKYRLSL